MADSKGGAGRIEAAATVSWQGWGGEVSGESGKLKAQTATQVELGGPGQATNPEELLAGLRVAHLGRSSVRYEIGIFGPARALLAFGWFVHVFVDRETRRPTPIPDRIRTALERLVPT